MCVGKLLKSPYPICARYETAIADAVSAPEVKQKDQEVGLDKFLSKYTSEDNESFDGIMERQATFVSYLYFLWKRAHNQLGTLRGAKSFLRGRHFFETMSNTFFQGEKPPAAPSYGPVWKAA